MAAGISCISNGGTVFSSLTGLIGFGGLGGSGVSSQVFKRECNSVIFNKPSPT